MLGRADVGAVVTALVSIWARLHGTIEGRRL